MALAIDILAGGRAKSAPETALAETYLMRARDAGRALGLTSFQLTEYDERRPERIFETVAAVPLVVALDEKGKSLSSEELSRELARWRDAGSRARCL